MWWTHRIACMKTRLAAVAVAVVAALSLAACTDDTEPTTPPQETAVAPQPGATAPAVGEAQPGLPQEPQEGFEGEIQTESIKVGPMDVTVPKGMKLPESTIVTDSQESYVMMIDEDPQPVIDAVFSSAEEAGYEVYAELDNGSTVFVGNGNAVLFDAYPNAQILTWGPEAMKDALAQG